MILNFDSHSSHIQISPSFSELLNNILEASTCSLHEGTPTSLEIKWKVYSLVAGGRDIASHSGFSYLSLVVHVGVVVTE